MGEAEGDCEADEDERTATHERVKARVEEGRSHAAAILFG